LLGLPAALQHQRQNHSHPLHPGDTVILYTDGLVERTDENIDDSIASLVSALAPNPTVDLDALCEAVLAARNGDTRDDVALLAMRVTAS
jgi:serine phosphatase RsbU (regulator of sigma subunit)